MKRFDKTPSPTGRNYYYRFHQLLTTPVLLYKVYFLCHISVNPLIPYISFSVGAPGAVNCTALRVGPKVITHHSCTTASSAPGTVCSFTCPHGYKLSGPPNKHCGINGSWTDEAVPVSCNGK